MIISLLSFSVISSGPLDIDSLRLYSEIAHISAGNSEMFFKFQVPIIQDSLYILFINMFGWNAPMLIFPAIFTLLLAFFIGYITFNFTSSIKSAVFSILFFYSMDVVIIQSLAAPLYPLAIFFAYAGLLFIWNSLFRKKSPSYSLIGGAFLVFSLYSHTIGLFFFPLPFILWLFSYDRSWKLLFGIYFMIILIASPWIINHFDPSIQIDSFERDRWMVKKDYINIINEDFWGYRTTTDNQSLLESTKSLFRMIKEALGLNWIMISILTIIGIFKSRNRELIVTAISSFTWLFVTISIIGPGAFGRYIYPVIPLFSIGSAISFGIIYEYIKSIQIKYILNFFLVITLLIAMFLSLLNNNFLFQNNSERIYELNEIARIIDDRKGIIGARPTILFSTLHENLIYSHDYVSEEDYILFLQWPSDNEVKRIFKKHDIGWILLNKPIERFERDFHGTWLKKVYNAEPKHYIETQKSDLTFKMFEGENFILYKVV
jgi:hypothetical protein